MNIENPELQKTLQQLADKLGVGVDRLWACMIKQAPIDATINIITWFGLLALTVGTIIACWILHKKNQESGNDYDIIVAVLGIASACLIMGIWGLFSTYASLTLAGLYNPDYWALHQILHP
jgi:uncharacterized membrane protein